MRYTKVDVKLFQEEMRKSGYIIETLAAELKLSRTGLFNKIHNKSEFKASEIATISALFKLTKAKKDSIFFTVNVE